MALLPHQFVGQRAALAAFGRLGARTAGGMGAVLEINGPHVDGVRRLVARDAPASEKSMYLVADDVLALPPLPGPGEPPDDVAYAEAAHPGRRSRAAFVFGDYESAWADALFSEAAAKLLSRLMDVVVPSIRTLSGYLWGWTTVSVMSGACRRLVSSTRGSSMCPT